MKFTIITRYYYPTPDGIGHHSGYLNQYLIEAGHAVQIIYDDGIISLQEKGIGILVNKIKRHRSDWVIFQYNGYSYNRFGAPSWLSSLFKKITYYTDAKLCMIVHETFIRKDTSLKLKIYRFLQKRSLRIASKHAKLILTTTHLYQQQLREFGRKSEVFFTPSNFENYINALENKFVNSKLKIGTFGNRDPKFLLEIISGLEAKGLICDFEFIGNYQPKYIKEIKSATKKLNNIKISRSGKLTDNNIVRHLATLDAFILLEPVRPPDGGGGLNTKSGASATALCMGIPIFSTFGDFTKGDVFIENQNYIRLNSENPTISTEIIYNSLNDKDKLNKLGQEGKNLYRSFFSWSSYSKRLLSHMKEAMNSGSIEVSYKKKN